MIFCQFRRLAEAHPESNVIGKSVQKPKQGLAELQEKELEKSPLSRRPRIREVWSALKRMEKKFECDSDAARAIAVKALPFLAEIADGMRCIDDLLK